MFDIDSFVVDCREALHEAEPRRAVREVLLRALDKPSSVADALAKERGGMEVIYSSPDLTVVNVMWAPQMSILPHDHRMWAAIGIYGGREANTLYRRHPERIQPAGTREIREAEVLVLGADAIHSVSNPEHRLTGAIHVYGGDFVNAPRSQWDPDTLTEQPYDLAYIRKLFAIANAEWVAQVGNDLDDKIS